MDNQFFERPILNSPYEHQLSTGSWMNTAAYATNRRKPPPGRVHHPHSQASEAEDLRRAATDSSREGKGLSTEKQEYDAASAVINELRYHVDQWRRLPNPNDWKVTPDT
jgi:type III restriction enzyme